WRYFSARRVSPAAKRLDPDDNLAALVHNGLVQEPQAVLVDCLPQVGLKQLAGGQLGIPRPIINARAITAFILGAVERHVRVAHDVGRGAGLVVDHRNSIEAPMMMFCPLITYGAQIAAMMRCARPNIFSLSPAIDEITANSSPPRRATRSPPRSVCERRRVTLRIKSSPT